MRENHIDHFETEKLNHKVRRYWEKEPCNTEPAVIGGAEKFSLEWSQSIEKFRYETEPFIHSIAQFTRHQGSRLLEIGVGAGTDHLQWARAGADCYGVDLTDAGIETTRKRLALFGLTSKLQRVDAEKLPFENGFFDIVYSWGVIHHSEKPEAILAEVHRVLKPGGKFIGMFYNRHSLYALKLWVKFGVLKGKPFQSLAKIIWNHQESLGTQAYTEEELQRLFSQFGSATFKPLITEGDLRPWPKWINRYFPNPWGWFIAIEATK